MSLEPLAAPPDEPAARPRNDLALTTAIVLAVALAFLAGFGVGRISAPGADAAALASLSPAPSAASASPAPSAAATASVSLPPIVAADDPTVGLPSSGASLGSAEAPVTIEVWSDFQCPFCGKYVREVEPWIIETYVSNGTVRLVHRDLLVVGQESLDAAVLARYATQHGKFWAVYELLFANQSGENKGAFSRARLAEIGSRAGLDPAKVTAALNDASLAQAAIAEAQRAIDAGIKSTPTMVINGTTAGAGIPDRAAIAAMIERAMAGS